MSATNSTGRAYQSSLKASLLLATSPRIPAREWELAKSISTIPFSLTGNRLVPYLWGTKRLPVVGHGRRCGVSRFGRCQPSAVARSTASEERPDAWRVVPRAGYDPPSGRETSGGSRGG